MPPPHVLLRRNLPGISSHALAGPITTAPVAELMFAAARHMNTALRMLDHGMAPGTGLPALLVRDAHDGLPGCIPRARGVVAVEHLLAARAG